ncbi:MAG: hypothetical protein GY870_22130 [archaeon]|nr:hypothetical protein [archaeon]
MSDGNIKDEFEKYFSRIEEQIFKRDQDRQLTDIYMRDAVANFKSEIMQHHKDETISHREHIQKLYSRFEKIVYILVIVILGVVGYLGFEVKGIPNKINETVVKYDKKLQDKLDQRIKQNSAELKTKIEKELGVKKKEIKNYVDSAQTSNAVLERLQHDSESFLKSIEKNEKKIITIFNDSQKLYDETHEQYTEGLKNNTEKLKQIKSEFIAYKYEKIPAKKPKDLIEIINATKISKDLNDNDLYTKLLTSIELSLLSIDITPKVKSLLDHLLESISIENKDKTLNDKVIKIGILSQNEPIIAHIRSVLTNSLNEEKNRDSILNIFSVFYSPFKRLRFFSELKLLERRYLTKRFSKKDEANLSIFKKELLKLIKQVEYPAIAKGAYENITIDELSKSEKDDFYNSLKIWFTNSELYDDFLNEKISSLPLDTHLSDFYTWVLSKDCTIEDSYKKVAVKSIIKKLVSASEKDIRVFLSGIELKSFLDFCDEQQQLKIKFMSTRNKIKSFRINIAESPDKEWFSLKPTTINHQNKLFTINSWRSMVNKDKANLTIEILDFNSGSESIINQDNSVKITKPLKIFEEGYIQKFLTKDGKQIGLQFSLKEPYENLELGFAIVESN